MPKLSIEDFLNEYDAEVTRYRIQAAFKDIRDAFGRNEVYPHLSDLIELQGTLTTLEQRISDLRDALPQDLRGLDIENKQLVYEELSGGDHLNGLSDLIAWSIPLIIELIEEGKTIFEFVEDNLSLEEVGIVPSYLEEGYLIVADALASMAHVLRYQLSIFTGADEKYPSLRTRHIDSEAYGAIQPPFTSIKLRLVEEYRELPNPATYACATYLDFPYRETVLPIAKRKLMRHIYGHGRA